MKEYIDKVSEIIELRGLASNTQRSYKHFIKTYLAYVETSLKKMPEDVTWEEMRGYSQFLKEDKKLSNRTINAHFALIRFFTRYVLYKPWDYYQMPVRKFDRYLPTIPTQEEAVYFIKTIPNLKHKALVALLYSAGLRVSEVCNLKYSDVSRKNMKILIAPSKSRSERFAILSKNTLDILTDYWYKYSKPQNWLFPSTLNNGVSPISVMTVNRIVNDHINRLGWSKKLNCHSFRHGFGTHLYEQGVDLLIIQKLLGHSSIDSTTIYVHLANYNSGLVKSPFDNVGIPHE
jgi:site-specific recombinase XerD